jgi:hypothetical protein
MLAKLANTGAIVEGRFPDLAHSTSINEPASPANDGYKELWQEPKKFWRREKNDDCTSQQ